MTILLVSSLVLLTGVAPAEKTTNPSPTPPSGSDPSPDDGKAVALLQEAAHLYDQGLLDESLAKLQQAQALSSRPGILYNIGQIQRARHDCATALEAYTAFLAQTPPSDPNRERAARWQSEMQVCVDKAAAATPSAQPSGGGPLPPAPRVIAIAAPEAQIEQGKPTALSPSRSPELRHSRPAMRIAGWSLLGAGALAGVAAVLLQLEANSIQRSLDTQAHPSEEYNRLHGEGDTDARWALVSGIGAVALAATGATVLVVTRPSGAGAQTTALLGWAGSF